MNLVRIGRLGRPHGLQGTLALDGADLTADELMAVKTFVWRGKAGAERELVLENARDGVPRALVHFRGIDSRESAGELVNGELWAEPEQIPDPGPGVAYTFQLMGSRVVTEDGRELGTLADILATGAHPVYVVRGEREWMLPAHPGVVKQVDLKTRLITVELPAGIEDV